MASIRFPFYAEQGDHIGLIFQIFDEQPGIKSSKDFRLVSFNKCLIQARAFSFGDSCCFVRLLLPVADLCCRRQFENVAVLNIQISQFRLESFAIGKGVPGSTNASSAPQVTKCVDAGILQRLARRLGADGGTAGSNE